MLALAIPIDIDGRGNTIVETNAGHQLKAPRWPQDSEFQLVAFRPSSRTCQIIWADQLAEDIAKVLELLDKLGVHRKSKPDWRQRLKKYSDGIGQRVHKRSQG